MPKTVMMASQGVDVLQAQAQLNLGPSQLPPLSLDSIFGAKTKARTIEFQKASGLTADGIIGPKTWAALLKLSAQVQPVAFRPCGNSDEGNQGRSLTFASAIKGGAIQTTRSAVGGGKVTANAMTIGGVSVVALNDTPHKAVAQRVYLDSIHYDRVFFSTALGLQDRPFTVATMAPPFTIASLPFGGFIQIINGGPNPSRDTIIHEMGHVWQSQHHIHGGAYLVNCIRCQAAALEANLAIGAVDPSVTNRKKFDWPGNYPISAYGYRPGAAFESYGGEQIAEQIEKGENAILARIVSVPAGLTDGANVRSLLPTHIRTEDLRASGVKV